ncbi:MbtH family protein [Streptomyces sp. NPDC087440]|uniref:MbtH family protein n=1 Tax=Streptomyces sp. NPDC087440 TaxID=3365790 RepID=UPI0037F63780
MPGLFEDDSREYLVLRNAEEQYSLWPDTMQVPAGWNVVNGPAPRQKAIEFVDRAWSDMRPKSLRNATVGQEG